MRWVDLEPPEIIRVSNQRTLRMHARDRAVAVQALAPLPPLRRRLLAGNLHQGLVVLMEPLVPDLDTVIARIEAYRSDSGPGTVPG